MLRNPQISDPISKYHSYQIASAGFGTTSGELEISNESMIKLNLWQNCGHWENYLPENAINLKLVT